MSYGSYNGETQLLNNNSIPKCDIDEDPEDWEWTREAIAARDAVLTFGKNEDRMWLTEQEQRQIQIAIEKSQYGYQDTELFLARIKHDDVDSKNKLSTVLAQIEASKKPGFQRLDIAAAQRNDNANNNSNNVASELINSAICWISELLPLPLSSSSENSVPHQTVNAKNNNSNSKLSNKLKVI